MEIVILQQEMTKMNNIMLNEMAFPFAHLHFEFRLTCIRVCVEIAHCERGHRLINHISVSVGKILRAPVPCQSQIARHLWRQITMSYVKFMKRPNTSCRSFNWAPKKHFTGKQLLSHFD